jgi:hypothetical protein
MTDSSYTNDPGTHKVVVSGSNPFVSPSTYNFALASDTSAGTTLTSVGTYWNGTAPVANTFTTDMNGVTRGSNGTWDRGAFQYQPAINPPTNLAGVVH